MSEVLFLVWTEFGNCSWVSIGKENRKDLVGARAVSSGAADDPSRQCNSRHPRISLLIWTSTEGREMVCVTANNPQMPFFCRKSVIVRSYHAM